MSMYFCWIQMLLFVVVVVFVGVMWWLLQVMLLLFGEGVVQLKCYMFDYFVDNFLVIEFDQIGMIQYWLMVVKLVYYEDIEGSDLIDLVMCVFQFGKLVVMIIVKCGIVNGDVLIVDLYDDVCILCVVGGGDLQMQVDFQYFWIFVNDDVIQIEKLVKFQCGLLFVNVIDGMKYNNVIWVIEFYGNVCGMIVVVDMFGGLKG